MMNSTLKTTFAVLIAIFAWGSAFVFIRIGVLGYSPGPLALFRFFISSCLMGIFYLRLPIKHKPTLKEFVQIFLIGFFGIAVYMVLLNYGEITVSASISSFIIGMSPIVSLFWASIFFQEKINFENWLGVGVSVIGLLIIAMSRHNQGKLDEHVLFVLGAAVLGGIYNVAQKPLIKKFHPVELATLAAWSATFALLFFLPKLIHEIPRATWHATSGIIYLGIIPGTIGYLAWSYTLNSKIPASKLVLTLYALPLISTLLGWIILDEIPPILSLFGGVVALLGALIATRY